MSAIRLTVTTPDIRPEEPGLDAATPYANDWIGFDGFGAGLTRLTQYGSGSGVVLVDGQWGWGKTTFAKMWVSSMRSEGRTIVHVNAWTGDYADSPFDDIVEQLRRGLREQNKGLGPLVAAAIAKTTGTLSWAGGVRALQGVAEFVDPNAIVPTARLIWALGRAARGVARKQARRMMRLNKRLARAARQYGRRRRKSLVVVVDELDRCRPDYALRFLETIKHVFEVPNVTFIVTANAGELANAVNGVYGARFDGESYVERFFDILLPLPLGDRANFVRCCLKEEGNFRNAAAKDVVFDTPSCRREAPDVAARLLCSSSLSPRQIKKAIKHTVIALLFNRSDDAELAAALVFVGLVRHIAPAAYRALVRPGVSDDEVANTLIDAVDLSDELECASMVVELVRWVRSEPSRLGTAQKAIETVSLVRGAETNGGGSASEVV